MQQINVLIHLQINYMINSTLHVNKLFRVKYENFLRAPFHQNNMEGIKNVMRKITTASLY